jgi:hypothetical protein
MPVVDTTTPFSNNEQITSTKLNNIMDNSFFVSGAVVPSSGLEVTAGGQMQIPNGGIKTALLENSTSTSDGVTTAKIADLNVTAPKLAASLDLSGKTVILPNNSVTPANLTQKITSGTAVTASGTSVDFTGIPSWAKRITVVLQGVSTNGTSGLMIQVGTSSGFVTSGYSSVADGMSAGINPSNWTTGFGLEDPTGNSAGWFRNYTCTLINISSNNWVFSTIGGITVVVAVSLGGGNISLGGSLDRLRLTTLNGTDQFDAGSVNIVYE